MSRLVVKVFFVQKNCYGKSYLVHLVEFMFVLRNKSNYLLKHFITTCSRKPLCAGIFSTETAACLSTFQFGASLILSYHITNKKTFPLPEVRTTPDQYRKS